MLAKEELILIVYFIVIILLLTSFGVLFFVTFQRRKNKLIYENFEAEKRFEKELTLSKLEIQEQTLKNVGWELHDNIGQLLSVANMQLNMLGAKIEGPEKGAVAEIQSVVSSSLQEVRSLSKSLNHETVHYAGLEASVRNELSRFKRLNIIDTEFIYSGESIDLPPKDAIILFRIIQEFCSNAIKHSKATKLEVAFCYNPGELKIRISDNGIGFETDKVQKSSGLLNMCSRAELIHTEYNINSSTTKGTELILCYPIRKHPLNE